MTYGECNVFSKKNEIHDKISNLKGRRQLLQTNLSIGEYFKSFPLYFSTQLDYRFRMYPLQYLLSRVTGFLKYMLEDFVATRLTKKGLINMMEAYYVIRPDLLRGFLTLKGSLPNKKELEKFFLVNKIPNV